MATIAPTRLPTSIFGESPEPCCHFSDGDGLDESFTHDVTLDAGYYERGVAARHNAQQRLDDITGVFDEIENRADALLENLLTLLDGVAGASGPADAP